MIRKTRDRERKEGRRRWGRRARFHIVSEEMGGLWSKYIVLLAKGCNTNIKNKQT